MALFDGAELVVRGTGGALRAETSERGRPQIARARVRQWSPRVEARFLEALAATCNAKAACAEVGLSPASAYNHRRRCRLSRGAGTRRSRLAIPCSKPR